MWSSMSSLGCKTTFLNPLVLTRGVCQLKARPRLHKLMSDSLSLRDRYFALIDEIVQTTLKGKIRSKQQVIRCCCAVLLREREKFLSNV
jgi:hypothetical protein